MASVDKFPILLTIMENDRVFRQMRLAFAVIIFSLFATNTLAEKTCGQSRLDPADYSEISSHADLRKRLAVDLLMYRDPNGLLSISCFMQHYSALGSNQPFGTTSVVRYGTDDSHEVLYYLDILVWRRQRETDLKTSVGYWVKLTPLDGALVAVDDHGRFMETVLADTLPDVRMCSSSQFDSGQFQNVRSKPEIERLIEQAILAYLEADGEVDWMCFAEAFMEMDNELPEQFWVSLLPEGADQRGVYRFTIRNVQLVDRLLPAPGASNGEFTAIVRAENSTRIAIVETGGNYRWLGIE